MFVAKDWFGTLKYVLALWFIILLTHYCTHKLVNVVAIWIVFHSFVFKLWAVPSYVHVKVMNDFETSNNNLVSFTIYRIHYHSFFRGPYHSFM